MYVVEANEVREKVGALSFLLHDFIFQPNIMKFVRHAQEYQGEHQETLQKALRLYQHLGGSNPVDVKRNEDLIQVLEVLETTLLKTRTTKERLSVGLADSLCMIGIISQLYGYMITAFPDRVVNIREKQVQRVLTLEAMFTLIKATEKDEYLHNIERSIERGRRSLSPEPEGGDPTQRTVKSTNSNLYDSIAQLLFHDDRAFGPDHRQSMTSHPRLWDHCWDPEQGKYLVPSLGDPLLDIPTLPPPVGDSHPSNANCIQIHGSMNGSIGKLRGVPRLSYNYKLVANSELAAKLPRTKAHGKRSINSMDTASVTAPSPRTFRDVRSKSTTAKSVVSMDTAQDGGNDKDDSRNVG